MIRNLLSKNTNLAASSAALMLVATFATQAHAANKPSVKNQRHLDFDSCAVPQYPTADLQAQHEGAVTLLFKLDQKGAVTDSKIEKSSGFPGLDEAARGALAKCKFSAAKAGVKYAKWAPVQYVWKLK
jgi:TonB family protein